MTYIDYIIICIGIGISGFLFFNMLKESVKN